MTRSATWIVLGAVALSGCQTRLTGNEGNLVFSYWSDDDVTNFNKPIAVGASLDIKVAQVNNRPVSIDAASFDDPGVLDVASFDGDTVTVTGTGDGGALLSVDATTPGGASLSDSVNLLARVPEVIKLNHSCTLDREAAYLIGQQVWVYYEMEMSNGQPVIGYGYYPLALAEGGPTLDKDASSQWYVALDTGALPGQATLRSEIDDTTLLLDVHDAGDIDGIQEPIAGVIEDVDVGDVNPFYVRSMVGDRVVCQGDLTKTVTSLTPDICDVRDTEEPADADREAQAEYGWFEIEGVAAGTCQYEVSFPQAGGGAGVSRTFTYEIEP